jgi:type IV pilus assembly protein PilO
MATKNAPGSKLAPFFQNLEKLSKPQRMAIYAATLIVIIALSVYVWLWPKHVKINALEQQLTQAQRELAVAKKNASELNDWRNKMKQKEAQYKTVMRELPEKEEIPTLLSGISQAGKDAGLDFLLFQPKKESAKGFFAEIPVDISVSGTYHQVAVFFDKVSNLPRIVNIRDIKMAPASKKEGRGILTTSCQAVTYKFIQNSGNAKQNRRTRRHR